MQMLRSRKRARMAIKRYDTFTHCCEGNRGVVRSRLNVDRIGIAAYRKKEFFNGGTANIRNIKLSGVVTPYDRDDLSVINITK